ncbi:MAG TPA: biotin-dependent carboxyltransferase family protein [Syntrophorhabdaceae bacterium]|nr:biotin-dependent carboxyltransferase family protein [Syntrophorhabdaceae bacterium]
MIEIINPGLQSIVVDNGRYGFADIGVPASSALDGFAYKAVNLLTGHLNSPPVIESIGPMFSLVFHSNMTFAITGAWVDGTIDDRPLTSWQSIKAKKGSILKIKRVLKGFRYYLGFSGIMDLEKIMGSYTTNMECHFGGYGGRPLKKGDTIRFTFIKEISEKSMDSDTIPNMDPPHILRVVDGPEEGFFREDCIGVFFRERYKVSPKSNRTGVTLAGPPVEFKEGVEKSIISEGVLPGTIQIPGDGMPVILLHERTVGGYARLGVIARVDQDLLAHLKPGDDVVFKRLSLGEAEQLWMQRQKKIKNLLKFD